MKQAIKEAIALEYGKNTTPVVTAKGDAELAQKIIEEALKHGVYVAQDPQLLALLGRMDLEAEIPPEMYTAVAVILSWVYWLKGMRPGDEKANANSQDGMEPMDSANSSPPPVEPVSG